MIRVNKWNTRGGKPDVLTLAAMRFVQAPCAIPPEVQRSAGWRQKQRRKWARRRGA